jgi:hypothetical protein
MAIKKEYDSLYKAYKTQSVETVFAHFYPINGDYDEPFNVIARATVDGIDAWHFQQQRFKDKYTYGVPKLRNYLNYTFKRLVELEQTSPGKHFVVSSDHEWVAFNTGLQNGHGSDLLAAFNKYKPRTGMPAKSTPD